MLSLCVTSVSPFAVEELAAALEESAKNVPTSDKGAHAERKWKGVNTSYMNKIRNPDPDDEYAMDVSTRQKYNEARRQFAHRAGKKAAKAGLSEEVCRTGKCNSESLCGSLYRLCLCFLYVGCGKSKGGCKGVVQKAARKYSTPGGEDGACGNKEDKPKRRRWR